MPTKRTGKNKPLRRAMKKFWRKSGNSIRRSLDVHHFKYKTLVKNFGQVEFTGSDQFFSRNFKITDIQNYGELEALFDLYRINAVEFELIPRQNTNYSYQPAVSNDGTALSTDFGGTNLFGASNFGVFEIVTVIDYDDATAPITYQELLEYSNAKITRGFYKHKRKLVPRMQIDALNTGVSKAKQWIDFDRNNVPHYGIKGGYVNVPNITLDGTENRPVAMVDMIVTYYISCKETR